MKQEVYQINPRKIFVEEDRIRKEFDEKKLRNLAESIKSMGQLQPGVCTEKDGVIKLIAGERRLRACALAEQPFSFVLKEEVEDELLLKEIELEENLQRENLTWLEEVMARYEYHNTLVERFGKATPGLRGGHTIGHTAERLRISRSILAEDIELAMWAKEIDEIRKAQNKSDAKAILKRIRKTVERTVATEAATSAMEQALPSRALVDEAKSPLLATPFSSTQLPSDGNALAFGDEPFMEEAMVEDTPEMARERRLFEMDRRCLLGKMEDRLSDFRNESIDVIIWDPPWGVNFDEVQRENPNQQQYSDNRDDFLRRFPEWLSLLWNKMAANSHLYLFFGITNHEFIYSNLEKAGFVANRIPIIWYKRGMHRTRNPRTWYGRSYEPIAFARKGNKNLVMEGTPDHIETAQPSPAMKKDHPSAKHPDVLVQLIRASMLPGEILLDPMSGSGMTGVAAERLRHELMIDWYMIEMDENFRNLGLFNVNLGYDNVTKRVIAGLGDPDDRPEHKPDFRLIPKGSPEWKQHWQQFPEDQDEMLLWGKNGGTNAQ